MRPAYLEDIAHKREFYKMDLWVFSDSTASAPKVTGVPKMNESFIADCGHEIPALPVGHCGGTGFGYDAAGKTSNAGDMQIARCKRTKLRWVKPPHGGYAAE